jgi:hypothetical protein
MSEFGLLKAAEEDDRHSQSEERMFHLHVMILIWRRAKSSIQFPFPEFHARAAAILIDELDARQILERAVWLESFHESSPYLFREP